MLNRRLKSKKVASGLEEKSMKDFWRVLTSKELAIKNDNSMQCRSKCIVSVVLCIAAAMMLIMNLKNHSMTMAYSSIILVVGFLASAIVAGIIKQARIAAVIIAVLVGFVLSVFALTGGNEGFAILWILLVPLFAINILGIVPGLLVSTYFLIFLFVLFFTPAHAMIDGKYTASFVSRFPILYLSDYLIASFFALQREYFHRSLALQVYTDGLTGVHNRRYYMESLQKLEVDKSKDYAIVMLDLNGLKAANDSLGHEAGDEMIVGATECCKAAFDKNDIICRIGGDEYAIVTFGDKAAVCEKIEKLKKKAKKWKGKYVESISFAVGCAHSCEDSNYTYQSLMKKADEEMYKDKTAYYQEKGHNRRKR